MRTLDYQEKLIIREIIKDPRISDNQISINVKVPLKTVNRKRKKLEEEKLLYYFAHLNNAKSGTQNFNALSMYIVIFKSGITKGNFLEIYEKDEIHFQINTKHILSSYLGEFNGHLALVLNLESKQQEDILEIFNAELVPQLKRQFGDDCIKETLVFPLDKMLRVLHNYLPSVNMENGKIKKDLPNENIFISD